MNVFSQNRRGSDLLLIGELHLDLINGKSLRTEFIARMVVAAASLEDEPRFELYQAWTVSRGLCPQPPKETKRVRGSNSGATSLEGLRPGMFQGSIMIWTCQIY